MQTEKSDEKKEDYYEILGINKDSDQQIIKKAYYKLAKKWHPDHNINNKEEAEQKFKLIAKAFEILSNVDKRKAYDNGEEYVDKTEINSYEIFNNISIMNVPDSINDVDMTLEELYFGVNKKVLISRYNLCDKCNGNGTVDGQKYVCKTCEGSGQIIVISDGIIKSETECKDCRGSGIDESIAKCDKCNGARCIEENIFLDVEIPAGLHDKCPIIIPNMGHELPKEEQDNETTRSDIVLIIKEKEHNIFKHNFVINDEYNFTDLMIDIKVSFAESLTGFARTFRHISKKDIFIKVEKPIRHNDMFYIEGEGLIKDKSKLYIKFIVDDPPDLSFTKRQKLWQLLTNTSFKFFDIFDNYAKITKI